MVEDDIYMYMLGCHVIDIAWYIHELHKIYTYYEVDILYVVDICKRKKETCRCVWTDISGECVNGVAV